MPTLWIDNQQVTVPDGATLLDAAQAAGQHIPTLCFLRGRHAPTSCMVCLVKLDGRLTPSCATVAREGMRVESRSPDVLAARKTAIELLLSDHVGDCVAPCQLACPAGMDIPRMIRQLAAGDARGAIETIKRDIALPAILGRICPAPCEKACRRGQHDSPVAICLLRRFAADTDLAAGERFTPSRAASTGRKVAIVGAGPAGLSGAYYLSLAGHSCTIFDDRDAPGGALRHAIDAARLPREVIDAEAAGLRSLGVEFRANTAVGKDITLAQLREQFDAVLLAHGAGGATDPAGGIPPHAEGFAAGDALRPTKHLAIRACADGKAAAGRITEYLATGQLAAPAAPPFACRMGKLQPEEMAELAKLASPAKRYSICDIRSTIEEASHPPISDIEYQISNIAPIEAARCLHCDCRKADNCRLRTEASLYGTSAGRYRRERRRFDVRADHPRVVYEPLKCIDCGLCIAIAQQYREPLGLAFIGRGFDIRVGVPLGESLAAGLTTAAEECVKACPTGALAFRD